MCPIPQALQRCCFALVLAGCLASSLYARQVPSSESQPLPSPDDNPIHFEHLTSNDGLSSNLITTVLQDHRGYLWIGTYGGGLHRYDGYEVKVYRHREGDATSLSDDRVRAIHESNDGLLWIGTGGGGLNRFDPASETFRNYRHQAGDATSLSHDRVRAIHESNDGLLWIGTNDGLNRFDPVTETFYAYRHREGDATSLSDDRVWAIHESNDGLLWIGTGGGGLNRFDPASETFRNYRHQAGDATSLSHDRVRAIYESKDGLLWIGTDDGLNRFDPVTETFYAYRHREGDATSLSDDRVWAIHESNDGLLWIGTSTGLNRLEFGPASDPASLSFIRFTAETTPLDRSGVNSITEDEEGQLWLGQDNGRLARFNPETGRVRYFGERHGLPPGSFTSAALRSRAGSFYWGNVSGLITFRFEDLPPLGEPPRVHLSELWLFNEVLTPGPDSPLKRPLSETQAVHFTHDQNDVTVGFVGLHYAHPEGNRYQYRLLPYDRDWRAETDGRRATYTNLPPGEYTFEVKASNSNGVWNEEGASLRIIVRPPWWRTTWAYLLYGLLFVGGVFAAYRFQHRRLIARERERAIQRELEQAQQIEAMNVQLREHEHQLEDQNRKLQELDHLKSRFFANISHEFRTPLTLMVGPIKDALDGVFGDLDERLQHQHRMVHRNGRRLLRLINQLLDLSRLEAGNLTLRARRANLVPLVKATAQAFASMARRKHITLQVDVPQPEIVLYFEPDKLEKVLFNLLSNAFKFTPEHGIIQLNVEEGTGEAGDVVEIVVRDTGQGIPAEALPFIFDRFHQVDASSTREQEGAGIGLALTKELVALHGGTIRVESEVGFGTAFFVRLPKGRAHLSDEDLVEAEDRDEVLDVVGVEAGLQAVDDVLAAEERLYEHAGNGRPAGSPPEDAPVILIVEDNADVRDYLRSHLAHDYHIVEAVDGVEGLERARALVPALVLSDVMMPRMDGYELCRAVKTDATLNHIPVVLLTARADEQSKVTGLETGADDYLYKPFDREELLVRVENLIEIRRQLRARFSKTVLVQPSAIEVTSDEAAFLEQAQAVVEAQVANSMFSAEMLADEMGVSRRHLDRRLKALTKLSASGLIRKMRLERAAQLLEKGHGNVSEVAGAVGFSSPDHFTRLFHQTFGVLPSQYPSNAS